MLPATDNRTGLIRRVQIASIMLTATLSLTAFGYWPFEGERARAKPGTRIKVDDSQFGKVLYSGRGQAIYYFDREKSKRPRCYGSCAAAWPPVLTKGRPKALGKVRQKLLGVTRRKGGGRQVTYAGHPLYYYAHEPRNVVFCHDVFQFNGLWLAARASGKPVG
ncbi:MAG TPA: hypothetical protein P5138_07765 [Solirubrobacterales bacterium]|nr:hypothetical protein [Solirubrobacterales bacterium]